MTKIIGLAALALLILTAAFASIVKMLFPRTGEQQEVDGSDSDTAKEERQKLYKQGWKRVDKLRCVAKYDMYRCEHKLKHPERYNLLRVWDLDQADEISGKTLIEITAQVQRDYVAWHERQGYCVAKLVDNDDCLHKSAQKPLHSTTERYLERLGYKDTLVKTPHGWKGLYFRG